MDFARAVVLVEGVSDQLAVEALAVRRGRRLDAEGISVVPIGGSKNIKTFLDKLGPQGLNVRLAGLYDAAEEGDFRRGLDRAGLGSNLSRTEMERIGFYACVADLEDELIRALGAAAVEKVIEANGELDALRSFQRQPQWRGRSRQAPLRRVVGTNRGRKIGAGGVLVDAPGPAPVPRALDTLPPRGVARGGGHRA